MYYFEAENSWENFLVLYGTEGLQAIKFTGDKCREGEDLKVFLEGRMEKPWPELLLNLKSYFKGIGQVDFNKFPVSLEGCSAFTAKVLCCIRRIPYGRVCSYSSAARGVGLKTAASRSVGKALGKNPLPVIIPCHRVVKKDGSVGGFYLGTGSKMDLLKFEGVKISKLGRVSDEIFICR